MIEIQNYINCKIKEIDFLLKKDKNKIKLIELKSQYLDFINLLKLYEKFKLTRKDILETFELPINLTDTSEYRIMEDVDMDDRNQWVGINCH